MSTEITSQPYGVTVGGVEIDQYRLVNDNGLEIAIINYGGIINSLRVPDRNGDLDDIVLGYDSLAEYESCAVHFGCITGRYANRISHGRFAIDGQHFQLETNRGQHHLHGASAGFGKAIWQAQAVQESAESVALVLRYLSADGSAGYPGNLQAQVVYRLTAQNQLQIEYRATTDKPTILNLTNHSYFNLRGHQSAQANGVLEHLLCLNANQFVPTDNLGIPLGGHQAVAGTPLDFRQASEIGARIEENHAQLSNGHGYDHNWVPNGQPGELRLAATVVEPASGRKMVVETTQPGVQFYSGNHLSDRLGKSGVRYDKRGALCLETQHYPDAPNHSDFPSAVIRPGDAWCELAQFSFSAV